MLMVLSRLQMSNVKLIQGEMMIALEFLIFEVCTVQQITDFVDILFDKSLPIIQNYLNWPRSVPSTIRMVLIKIFRKNRYLIK